MADSNSGFGTTLNNTYPGGLAGRIVKPAHSKAPVTPPHNGNHADCAVRLRAILSSEAFKTPEGKRDLLLAIEAAYEVDPAGVYELVNALNRRLNQTGSTRAVVLKRTAEQDCFGANLEVYDQKACSLLDSIKFRLDFASGKLIG